EEHSEEDATRSGGEDNRPDRRETSQRSTIRQTSRQEAGSTRDIDDPGHAGTKTSFRNEIGAGVGDNTIPGKRPKGCCTDQPKRRPVFENGFVGREHTRKLERRRIT